MEFLSRHYEKLILLALSVISVFAVWHMSGVMEKTRDVKDSDLQIRIPPADQHSLKQKKADYLSRKAELAKEIAKTQSELAKAEKKAKKSKDEESVQEESRLKDELNNLREQSRKLDGDAALNDFLASKEFDGVTLIAQSKLLWPVTVAHSALYSNFHSDLVDIFKMATCPYCHYGIPYFCFTQAHKCVICKKELKSPPAKIKKRRRPTPDDLDGDGINNDNELRYGLDPKDPGDALLDADSDGFSNLYEINVSQTNPRNSVSCPPLWRRLRFKGMSKIKLPIQISGVDAGNNPDDPKKWEVSIKMVVRDPRTGRLVNREQYCKIGETLKFDGRTYMMTSVKRRIEKNDRGFEVKRDIVVLKMIADNESEKSQEHELTLVFGEPVYSSDLRVVLEDVGVPAKDDGNRYYSVRGKDVEATFALRKGETFEMGGVSDRGDARNVPKVAYVLKDFNEREKVAFLSRAQNRRGNSDEDLDKDELGETMEVTADGFIVEDEWVAAPGEKQSGAISGGDNAARNAR